MKKRPYPTQEQPVRPLKKGEVMLATEEDEEATDVVVDGDALVKGIICKVCERKFQMSIFWSKEVPKVQAKEDAIRQAYQEHKRKIKDYEALQKECQIKS